MYQLNYRSKAAPNLTQEDINNILNTATTVNEEKNITGCLIYHNDSFVQILEGKKEDVLDVYEKIKNDPRHYDVHLLWENNVNGRYFEEWSMAFHNPENKGIQLFINNLLIFSEITDRSSGSLYSFWGNVRRVLLGGSPSVPETI
ncbi:BLUF domain-containing protein [Subsaxibacter sp. CAU 1640]|uniref:BLUF domain-containing protein n=1 Tax=Subsaxibacter sp. CAU 1640 TaxID=2933271 RepID=UPI002004BCC7|nr:BLUF domain-containing protein [Subsaxibacter sp. CAU 1640]MCK7591666.1 BLUF domain-containing protein [Subsaxibacter sp. CAU 1640]